MVLVVKPSLKEADRKKLLETVKSWLGKIKVKKEDDWGQKPLAYSIQHEDAGHYYMWQIEADPIAATGENGIPKDFEQRIVISENVLRHLLLRTK